MQNLDPIRKFSRSSCTDTLESLLLQVQKPARYIGHELNAVKKDPAGVKLRLALAFPDIYDVGMSHTGLKILYWVVNSRPELYAERVFAPWLDLEKLLRKEQRPLGTIETGTPLSQLDFVGFSLQYELCATSVLQMLDLGGIPLRAQDRGPNDPFVVGGGPVAFNPVPLAPFFDAFAVGDGEEVILELADTQVRWKNEGGSREDLLKEWDRLPGVFVPALHSPGQRVRRRIVADLDKAGFPSSPVLPFCEIVHDRIGIEIARGCSRGCRFCQAGMLYRPVRERSVRNILDLAEENAKSTGWEEVSLLSLSSGDYSAVGELVTSFTEQFGAEKVALSLPSLRTETLSAQIAHQIQKVRKTGFTLAPEAGTERLRRIINKGNTEEDLEKAVITAAQQGWRAMKLYFMIGLPYELDEDLDGIVSVMRQVSKWTQGGKLTASVSTFVPKSHTPFQWAGQIFREETERKQLYLKRHFTRGKTKIKFHDPRISFLEGVFARGDARLAPVVESAFRNGARFDGWEDQLKFELWMNEFEKAGIHPEKYLEARAFAEPLPWDFIDTGLTREFLVREWQRAVLGEATGDCRGGECSGCGVCDFDSIQPRLASVETLPRPNTSVSPSEPAEPQIRRLRLQYGKIGSMKLLGHQDLIRMFHRTFRRAGITLDYSKGFHPHPKLRFSPPLALGVESIAEYLDFDVVNCNSTVPRIMDMLLEYLPVGINPLDLAEISLRESTVSGKIQSVTYKIEYSDSDPEGSCLRKAREFRSASSFELTSDRKGKVRRLDLKEWVVDLVIGESALKVTLLSGPEGSVHPLAAAAAILGLTRDEAKKLRILKTSVSFTASCPTERD
jgi:radical SAM family uncharacterized protein/radical SAM-linked protein